MRLDPQPPVCLCIKTELCQKETLKTWLNTNRDNRSRVEITNWFLEVYKYLTVLHFSVLKCIIAVIGGCKVHPSS